MQHIILLKATIAIGGHVNDLEFKEKARRKILLTYVKELQRWLSFHLEHPTYKECEGFSVRGSKIRVSADFVYKNWSKYTSIQRMSRQYYARLLRLLSGRDAKVNTWIEGRSLPRWHIDVYRLSLPLQTLEENAVPTAVKKTTRKTGTLALIDKKNKLEEELKKIEERIKEKASHGK